MADGPADAPLSDELIDAALGEAFLVEGSAAAYGPLASSVDAEESRYVILGELARGGMGVVMRGEDLGLRRELAMKVSAPRVSARRGMLDRFVTEARICGRLQHPGIVPVYELGRLPDDRLYFTMKLVEGNTLEDLFRKRPDPGSERPRLLAILLQVCQAIAYAHSRGVIHRDLKPANVMVGAFGEVQVVDWGLAKEITRADAPLPELAEDGDADRTRVGSVLGTPGYAAPELARGRAHEADARVDVFGLGALLCELLTGAPPFEGDAASRMQLARDAELEPAFARIAASTAPPELSDLARRCLDPDPARRPLDGGEVARALVEHLDSVAERLRERELDEARRSAAAVVERRRRRLRSWLVVVVLVASFWGLAVWLTARARSSEARAKTARMGGYLDGVLEWFDPSEVRSPTLTLRELVDEAARRADADLSDDPLLAAEISTALAERYVAMGAWDEAVSRLRAAIATIEDLRGEDDASLLTPLLTLGTALTSLNEYERAEEVYLRAIDLAADAHGSDSPEVAKTRAFFGLLLKQRGESERARRELELAIAGLRGVPDSRLALSEALSNLSLLLRQDSELAAAEAPARESLAILEEELGGVHLTTAAACNNLGLVLRDRGKLDEAEPLFRRSLDVRIALLGEQSPSTAIGQNNLGQFLVGLGRLAEAETYFRSALATRRALLGTHEHTANVLENLASVLRRSGRPDEAVALGEEALAMRIEVLGDEHENVARSLSNLARARIAVGDLDGAWGLLERAQRILTDLDRTGTSRAVAIEVGRAQVLARRGLAADAEQSYRRALELAEQSMSRTGSARARLELEFGAFLDEQRAYPGALEHSRAGLEGLRGALPPRSLPVAEARLQVGETALRAGELEDAVRELTRACEDLPEGSDERERARAALEEARSRSR